MITAALLREARDWVDRSGVAPLLEALLRPTGRGRRRQLSVRTLLIGLKLSVDTAKTSCLTDVHRVLTQQLSDRDQIDLGVLDRRTGAAITVHQVRRLFDRVARQLDPMHMDTPAQPELLQGVLDRLLDATMAARVPHQGAYAIDGTGIWAWSRGRKRGQPSADPDARWGSKTAKSGGQEPYFGYELHALVRINSARQDRAAVPCLAERIVVVPAATNGVTAVLPTLGGLADAGAIRELVADRGYTYKNDWVPSLRGLGISPVLDLHPTQYGARGAHDGARIITGVPHCPATPAGLDTIKRPERLQDGAELDDFVANIARRERWAFRRVNTADTTGKERYECPARAGKVRCPLVRASMSKQLATPTVIGAPSPDTAPRCCTQRTITVAGDIDAKARQDHYWGTRAWINAYARRSRVEGWFGNLKSTNTEGLARGTFRVMGLAKTSLMLGIYAACTNLRLLRTWLQRAPQSTEPAGSTPPRPSLAARAPRRLPLRAGPPTRDA